MAAAVSLTGCGSQDTATPCTAIGAAWAADVSVLEQPGRVVRRLQVDLCDADRCERLASASPAEASNLLYLPDIAPGTVEAPLTVVATLVGPGGARLARSSAPTEFVTRLPNGEGCAAQTVLESVTLTL